MKKFFSVSILIFCTLSVSAEELTPMADFGIHTIVTSGPRAFEGKKLRAIVEYGELGFPSIFIESINVEMGYPSPSRVVWREKIDETGGIKNICQEPGVWRCSLENLRWDDSTLNYELKTSSGTYKCSAKVVEGDKINTNCYKP
jgi:hypothetical protein